MTKTNLQRPQSRQDWVYAGGTVLLCAAMCLFPIYLFLMLGRAIEPSDTGFYYANIAYPNRIETSVTQFGAIWKLLPLPDVIRWHRFANIALLFGSAAFASVMIARSRVPEAKLSWVMSTLTAVWGIAGASLYFQFWLLDPSYNSVAMTLVLALLGLSIAIGHAFKSGRVPPVLFVIAGVLGAALILTRLPTAGLVAPILILIPLLIGRPKVANLLKSSALCLTGIALLLILVSVFVSPIPEIVRRIRYAFTITETLNMALPISLHWERLETEATALFKQIGWIAIIAAGLLTVGAPKLSERKAMSGGILVAYWTALASALLWPALPLMTDVLKGEIAYSTTEALAHYTAFLTLVTGITAVLLVPYSLFHRDRTGLAKAGLIAALTACLAAHVMGSGNHWYYFASAFAVYPLLSLGLLLLRPNGSLQGSNLIAGLLGGVIMIAVQSASWATATTAPYRTVAPLSEQTVRTELRGGRSALYLDQANHDFYSALAAAQPRIDALESVPLLLDMTGGLPLVAYHLSLDIPGTAWLSGGYDWSEGFLRERLDSLPREQLCKAWILTSTPSGRSFDLGLLQDYGLTLEAYDIAATARSPYMDVQVELLAPSGNFEVCIGANAPLADL